MTREEALQAIKAKMDYYESDKRLRSAIETLVPELAESEDERIRKELIGALMWQRDCLDAKGPHDNELILPGFTMKVGDILEWLEKQKEHQNNSDAQEKALGRDLTFPQDKDKNLDEIAQDYVERVKEYNPNPTWNLMQTAVCYGYHCCEQKEQKPVPISCSHENGTSAEVCYGPKGDPDPAGVWKPSEEQIY